MSADVNSLKTRSLIIQNPDESFPAVGSVLAVTDRIGTIQPVRDISLASVTVDTINITGSILQNNASADEIYSIAANTASMTVKYNMAARDICANTIESTFITADDVSASTNYLANITANVARIDRIVDTHVMRTKTAGFAQCVTPQINSVKASIQTLTTPRIVAQQTTAINATFTDVSASFGQITDLSATRANFATLTATDVSNGTIRTNKLTVADKITVTNMNVSGNLSFNAIDLNTLIVTDMSATQVKTGSIKCLSATISDLSAQTYAIPSISVTGTHRITTVKSNTLTADSVNIVGATNLVNLKVTGQTSVNSLTVPTLNASTATSTSMTAGKIAATSITAPSITLNGGLLTTDSSTILVNGIATTDTRALYQVPFADVSASNISMLVQSFNSLLDILNGRGLVISAMPKIKFNSPVQIGIYINGVPFNPIRFSPGEYDLSSTIFRLNTTPNLRFSLKTVTAFGWQVTIAATPPIAIGDISGTAQSLQMLRYLGFNIVDASNNFQNYTISTTTGGYTVSVPRSLSGIYTGTIPISPLTNIPNTLSAPIVTFVSSTANTISFKLTNPMGNYLYLSSDLSNNLYPTVNTTQTIYNLAPARRYKIPGFFLDNYNTGPTALLDLSGTRVS